MKIRNGKCRDAADSHRELLIKRLSKNKTLLYNTNRMRERERENENTLFRTKIPVFHAICVNKMVSPASVFLAD